MNPLVLTYSHNVIEHLGLKLYQNRPTRVIAELVSNAWDADASAAWVELNMEGEDEPEDGSADAQLPLVPPSIEVNPKPAKAEDVPTTKRWIAVHDDGHGMTRAELSTRFLVIGAAKRSTPGEKSRKQRPLMGRKGIGKLAPFGIATEVDVVTCARKPDGNIRAMWIRLKLDDIKAQSQEGEVAKYQPIIVVDEADPDELSAIADPTSQVNRFLERIKASNGTGTMILLSSLFIHRRVDPDTLIESLGRRFTATFNRGFDVSVSGTQVDITRALPEFEYRIPEEGVTEEEIGDGRIVRYWVGFVASAAWPADEAGVGVYAHGKLCQDRPFTFGVKGKEIFARYMYAVVEADWLDELAEDLISTDRTSVNWDAPAVKALHTWGEAKVKQWVSRFETWRARPEREANKDRLKRGIADKKLPAITEPEQDRVADLLTKITPELGKDEEAKDRLADTVASAWLQEPMRDLVHDLWSRIGGASGTTPEAFGGVIEKLVDYSIPESLGLAVVFAQRAFALTKLYEYVHLGNETQLQRLIEEFPWIIEPDSAYLTANQSLRTVVLRAEEEGLIPTGRRKNVAGVPDDNRPDFVFLSSPENRRIVIVELKNPQSDLTIANREQLRDYLTYIEEHYPDAARRGYLIGRAPARLETREPDVEIIPWTDVMQRSRGRYVVFLAAMLTAAPTGRDERVSQVKEFAGDEVWALLRKIAAHNEKLARVMDTFKEE